MTDDRIDALIRRIDVPADPDPSFVGVTFAALKPQVRAARRSDASRIGRLRRDLGLILRAEAGSISNPVRGAAFGILITLAATAAILIAGALNRAAPIENGPLVVSIRGELSAFDSLTSFPRTIPLDGVVPHGVSRSPNGRLISFWSLDSARAHLFVIDVDGRNRREVASDLNLGWTDSIDVWSPDSRLLASEVTLDGQPGRILVVDIASGAASPVTPVGVTAHSPLWSPDGRSIAFTEEARGTRTLAVIRTDGTEKRVISGDVVDVAGPDTWSPDGTWIYFNNDRAVYRANARAGVSQLLFGNGLLFAAAYAPASSPDGKLIVFIVPRSDQLGYDLYIANSDGSGAHRLLERATHDGWSSDGRNIVVEWTPAGGRGGLAVIAPDIGDPQVLLQFDTVCQHGPRCTDGVGWGQPRP